MDEPAEELEPLFDYSRVQPADFVILDDDDFDSFEFSKGAKRKRRANPTDVKVIGTQNSVINLDDEKEDGKGNEEEDWLPPPPPRIPNSSSAFREDKTMQELRLKKQELASFAQSAEELLKTVKESAKKVMSNSAKPAMQPKGDQLPKTSAQRQKIIISIQDEGGPKQFRMYMDDKFERLFKMYADKAQLGLDRLVFCFDGDRVSPDATPAGLSLENDDMLEVHVKPH